MQKGDQTWRSPAINAKVAALPKSFILSMPNRAQYQKA